MQRNRPTRHARSGSARADSPDLAGLPPGLRQLVSYLGDKLAFALVQEFGGQELAIPKRASAEHAIAQTLGLHNMAALVQCFGGETITVHKHDSIARQIKHKRVARLLASGKTQNQVAAQTGYTARHVRNIAAIARAAELDMQPDLFLGFDTDHDDHDRPAQKPVKGVVVRFESAKADKDQPLPAKFGAHNPWGLG